MAQTEPKTHYETQTRERRTSVTTRLGDDDLELLDLLAGTGYGVDSGYWAGQNYLKKRGPAIRQAIREAAQRKGIELIEIAIENDDDEKLARGTRMARDPRDHRRQARAL